MARWQNETGHVELTWNIDRQGSEPRLRLLWEEIGGPPVTPPTRRGFGSTMIERSLKSYFRGEAKLEYRLEGLRFEVDCELEAAGMAEG
jgi:two-component sensor histidine kinase